MSGLITRRRVVQGLGAFALSTVALGGYAAAEPWRLVVTRYAVTPPNWPVALRLRVAVIADIHACEPWMPARRVRQIVERTNALEPDVVLLLGDFIAGRRLMQRRLPTDDWTSALADLAAPLGRHAILGNHDWWDDTEVQRRYTGQPRIRLALEKAGIPVFENDAVRLVKGGQPFWLAGLGDQWAYYRGRSRRTMPGRFGFEGVDDLDATLARVRDMAPVLMMIHEPDAFARMPSRVALTVAGHTHGGQVTLAGYAPVVPSMFGRRYVYGHVVEERRNLIVSGGLGCSGVPLRLGVPPEIVLIDIGGGAPA